VRLAIWGTVKSCFLKAPRVGAALVVTDRFRVAGLTLTRRSARLRCAWGIFAASFYCPNPRRIVQAIDRAACGGAEECDIVVRVSDGVPPYVLRPGVVRSFSEVGTGFSLSLLRITV
jgi:hypothetical protein